MIISKNIGDFDCKSNAKAKRITVRFRDGKFLLTYPLGVSKSEIESTIDKMGPRLISLKESLYDKHLKFIPGTELHTYSFTVKIIESNTLQCYVTLKDKFLYIACPTNSNFNDSGLQNLIRNHIEQHLRKEAKRIFPNWIKLLANKYNFDYNNVKINKSRSRWGSCSSQKNINISYYCLLLPQHLIELIILHELCHTIEMNHSSKFWQLLDNVTDGKAKQLTIELKQFKTFF